MPNDGQIHRICDKCYFKMREATKVKCYILQHHKEGATVQCAYQPIKGQRTGMRNMDANTVMGFAVHHGLDPPEEGIKTVPVCDSCRTKIRRHVTSTGEPKESPRTAAKRPRSTSLSPQDPRSKRKKLLRHKTAEERAQLNMEERMEAAMKHLEGLRDVLRATKEGVEKISQSNLMRLCALLQYYTEIEMGDDPALVLRRIAAAQTRTTITIQKWIHRWEDDATIGGILDGRGHYVRYHWFHDDNDFKIQAERHIWSHTLDETRQPLFRAVDFAKFVNETLLPQALAVHHKGARPRRITETTAVVWLKKLGYKFRADKKGMYIDGHERPEVVAYRKKFVEEFLELVKKRRSVRFEQYNKRGQFTGKGQLVMPDPSVAGKELQLFIWHDESCFATNDDMRRYWHKEVTE